MFAAKLRYAQCDPDAVLHWLRKLQQISFGRPDPIQRLLAMDGVAGHSNILVSGYYVRRSVMARIL